MRNTFRKNLRNLLPLILILFVTLLTFSNIFKNQFVWDDYDFIVNWQQIRDLRSNWPGLLKGDVPFTHQGAYRPLRSIYYSLAYSLFGQNPIGYHALGLSIHLVAVIFVYLIAKELTKDKLAAFFGTAIFAIHPVMVESVSWITASFDTIGIVFALASFYSYILYKKSQLPKLKWIYILLAAIAFFSAEITLVLPLLFMFYEMILQKKKTTLTTFKQIIKNFHELWIINISYWIIRFGILNIHEDRKPIFDSFIKTVWLMVKAVFLYLKLLFWPNPLTINHQIRTGTTAFYYLDYNFKNLPTSPGIFSLDVWIAFITLLVITIICIKLWKKNPLYLWGWSWFLIGLLPVMQLFPRGTIFAERYLYFASISIFLIAGLLLSKLIHKYPLPGWLMVMVLIGLMSFRTHNRNFAWQSNFTLWTATIKTGPESATAYNNLAEAAYSLGKINEALSAAQKAVSLNPNDITNLYNLANLNSVQKNFSEAIRYYQSITILDPDNPQSYSDLANAYMNMGNYKLAAQNYRKALNRLPGNIYLEQQLKIATSLFLKTINLPNMP